MTSDRSSWLKQGILYVEGIIHKDHGIGVPILEKKMETIVIRGSIGVI